MSSEDQMDHDDLDAVDEAKATAPHLLTAAASSDDEDEDMECGAEINQRDGAEDDYDDDEEEEEEDDDDDDEDEDLKLMKTYMEVLQRVSENKYIYADYVLLVNTAHEMNDLTKIRQSCELFADVYPLAPDIWLRWLRLELNIASTDAQYERVHQLFRRSLSDYYSTAVAREYANLAIKTPKSHETWEVLISTYTLHCMNGGELFAAWRRHCVKSEPDGPEKCAKLVRIYEQELGLPLHDMERTYVELKVLCEQAAYVVDWPQLDARYAAAKEQLARCMPFERRLLALTTGAEHAQRAAIYGEYIEAAGAFLNDRIVQVLHERMVTDCCLNASTWLRYIHYIQRRNNATAAKRAAAAAATSNAERLSVVFSQTDWDVCNRALRNCTWSAELYVEKLAIAERMELARDEVKAIAEQALAAGIEQPAAVVSIWLEYLAYLRRSADFKDERDSELVRATFALAWETLERLFGERADAGGEVLMLWARLEYQQLGDVARGKELWTTVMQTGANAYRSGMWMEFVQLEERWRGVDGARKIFRKALAVQDLDDVDCIMSAWVRFERCNGTLDQLKFAQRHCEQQRQKAFEAHKKGGHRRTNGASGAATASAAAGKRGDLKRRAPTDRHSTAASDPSSETHSKGSSRKHSKRGESPNSMGPPAAKPDKLQRPDAEAVAASTTTTAAAAVDADDEQQQHIDTTNDDVTIFLSNLSYSTTEADITAAFPELHMEHVNIIKSANGNSRGFSYVQLRSANQVQLSLSFDRRLINGRPTFISSVLRDKEQRKKFKYSTDVEPTKLFVKNLSFESTKEELEQAFGAIGPLKDVRLVLQKNGKPKGLAYIEYHSEKSASEAVMKLDQTELRGFKINVALSAPPPKPQPSHGAVSAASTLGTGRRAQTTRGEVKPRLSFIPSVVRKRAAHADPTAAPAQQVAAAPAAAAAAAAIESTPAAAIAPKSNADFRQFLTQSK